MFHMLLFKNKEGKREVEENGFNPTRHDLFYNNLHGKSVRTSQQTHYVPATENNRLMLFRKTVAVYCENHT
jgi:hypothetical protein